MDGSRSRRLARQSHHQSPAGQRLLSARPSSRCWPLRQHLRTHCPSFRTDASHLAVVAPNASTPKRSPPTPLPAAWGSEADRQRKLIARLDALIAQAQTG